MTVGFWVSSLTSYRKHSGLSSNPGVTGATTDHGANVAVLEQLIARRVEPNRPVEARAELHLQ